MEVFSMCGGIILFPSLIVGWILFCRRTSQSVRVRNVGLALFILPVIVGALSMGKLMIVDDSFQKACENGDLATVKQMISWGAYVDTDFEGRTPLGMAMYNGHEDVALYLLDHGAGPNTPCDEMTPLHIAEEYRLTKLVVVLKAKGAK